MATQGGLCTWSIFQLLLFMVVGRVCGLEVCTGPFPPPIIQNVSVTAILDSEGKVNGAAVSLELISQIPIDFHWVYEDGTQVREEGPGFESERKIIGERFISFLQDRIPWHLRPEVTSPIEPRNHRLIIVSITVFHICNKVTFILSMDEIIEMSIQRLRLPTLSEIPKSRHYISDGDESKIYLGFFDYGRNSQIKCQEVYRRISGNLTRSRTRPVTNIVKHENTTRAICEVRVPRYVESNLFHVIGSFETVHPSSGGSFEIRVVIATEFRKRDVTSPTLAVQSQIMHNAAEMKGEVTIAVTGTTAEFYCLGESDDHVSITLAEVKNNQTVKYVSQKRSGYMYLFGQYTYARYVVPSVQTGTEGAFYVCEAESRGGSKTQGIRIVHLPPIEITTSSRMQTVLVNFRSGASNNMTLTCEVTGEPKPRLTFTQKITFPQGKYDFRWNTSWKTETDLSNSNTYQITIRTEGNRIYGELTLPDIGRFVQQLRQRFKSTNMYFLVQFYCSASNGYDSKILKVGQLDFRYPR